MFGPRLEGCMFLKHRRRSNELQGAQAASLKYARYLQRSAGHLVWPKFWLLYQEQYESWPKCRLGQTVQELDYTKRRC